MRSVSFFTKHLDRWPIKVICIALAIILYILFRVNTLTERQLTIPLNVLTPEGFVVSSDYPDRINLTMRGDQEDIAGVLSDDVEAFVNLVPFPEEGEYQVPIEFRKQGTALQPEAPGTSLPPQDSNPFSRTKNRPQPDCPPGALGVPGTGL